MASDQTIAGRRSTVVGDDNATDVVIGIHGATQRGHKHWWPYTNFPAHTGFTKNQYGLKIYFADGGDTLWNGRADLDYILRLYDYVRARHPNARIHVFTFSMGGNAGGWLVKNRGADLTSICQHSALWDLSIDWEVVKVMGVIRSNESVGFISFNAPQAAAKELELLESAAAQYGGMQSMYNRAAAQIGTFVHGFPYGDHRVAGTHTWWKEDYKGVNGNEQITHFFKTGERKWS